MVSAGGGNGRGAPPAWEPVYRAERAVSTSNFWSGAGRAAAIRIGRSRRSSLLLGRGRFVRLRRTFTWDWRGRRRWRGGVGSGGVSGFWGFLDGGRDVGHIGDGDKSTGTTEEFPQLLDRMWPRRWQPQSPPRSTPDAIMLRFIMPSRPNLPHPAPVWRRVVKTSFQRPGGFFGASVTRPIRVNPAEFSRPMTSMTLP